MEVPLSNTLQAFSALGLKSEHSQREASAATTMATKSGTAPDADPPSQSHKSGVAPSSAQGGDTPPEVSGPSQAASSSHQLEEAAPEGIQPWLGEPGSLGQHRPEACDPSTRFSIELSKSFAACLRDGHRPWVEITPKGWVRLLDILDWPRVRELEATAGDVMEAVRHNEKGSYQLGLRAGVRYIRALQGHSRSDVDAESLLQELSDVAAPRGRPKGTRGTPTCSPHS